MGSFGENGFGIKYMIALTVLFFVVVCLGAARLWVLRRRSQREVKDIEAVAAASAERATEDVRYLTSKRLEASLQTPKTESMVEVSQMQSPPMAASSSPHPFLPSVFKDTYNRSRAGSSTSSKGARAQAASLAITPVGTTALAPAPATATAATASTSELSSPVTSLPPTPASPPKALSPPLSISSQRRTVTPVTPRLDTSVAPFLPPHELGTSSPSLEKAKLVLIPQRISNLDLDLISKPEKAESKSNLFLRRQQRQQKGSVSSFLAATDESTQSSSPVSTTSTSSNGLPDIPIVSPFRFSKPFEGVTINFDNLSSGRKSSTSSKRSGSSCSGKVVIVEKEILPTPPTDDSRKSYIKSGVNVKYSCMTPIREHCSLDLTRPESSVPINNNSTLQWVVDQQHHQTQEKNFTSEKKPSITVEMIEVQETPIVSPEASECPVGQYAWAHEVEPKQLRDSSATLLRDSNATLVSPTPHVSNLTHQILTSVYPYFPIDSKPSYPHPAERKTSGAVGSISEIYDCYAQQPEPSPSPISPILPVLPALQERQLEENIRASTIGAAVSTGLWVPGPWVNFDGYELASGNFPWKSNFLMSSKPFEESPIGSVPSPCTDDFKCLSPKSLTFDSEKCMCTPLPSPLPVAMPTSA